MFRRYLLLLALVAPLMIHAQEVRVVTRIVTDSAPAWKVWKGEGFSMHYPQQWNLAEPVQGDTLVVFSRAEVGAVQVCVQDMENMPVTRTGKDVDLDPAAAGSWENPRLMFERESDGTAMRVLEQLVSEGGRPFKLTYIAPQDSFEEYLFMAEAMINSFAAVEEDSK